MKPWQRSAAFLAALALGAALAYLPAAGLGWVWDDFNLVQPSPAIQDLSGLGRAVSTDLYRQAAPRLEASPYWRPLALASYWVDTRFGQAPGALHVGNLLLHALATALLALVLWRRAGPVTGVATAALAAAWWSLHPENVEPVAWISCRYDLLCALAIIGLLALPWRPGAGRAALHGLLFLAGLLSKDGFGAMLVVLAALDWSERRPLRAALPGWAAIAGALAVWWLARAALGLPGFGTPPLLPLARVYLDAARIYFQRAIAAPPLTISHPYAPAGALGSALGAVVVLGLAAAALWRRRLAAPVALFLAGLVPASVAIGKFGEVSERYFYLPSLGLALLVGELVAASLASPRPLRRLALPVVVGLVATFGLVRVEARLPDWQSDTALFTAAVRIDPEDGQANLQLGIEAGRRGDWAEARRALEIAQRADPDSGRIAGALAWALLRTHDAPGAIRQAERATAAAPRQPDGWYYLALARHAAGDHAGELAALERLLQASPDYPSVHRLREHAACEASGRTDCGAGPRPGEGAQ